MVSILKYSKLQCYLETMTRGNSDDADLTMDMFDAKQFIKYLKKVEGARERVVELPSQDQRNQIASLQLKPGKKGYSTHVRFIKEGSQVGVKESHLEPDTVEKPGGHIMAATTGDRIYSGLGTSIIRKKWAKFESSRCKRCGRAIWSPISVSRGYGSYCWSKL